jgi:hypothetical protein
LRITTFRLIKIRVSQHPGSTIDIIPTPRRTLTIKCRYDCVTLLLDDNFVCLLDTSLFEFACFSKVWSRTQEKLNHRYLSGWSLIKFSILFQFAKINWKLKQRKMCFINLGNFNRAFYKQIYKNAMFRMLQANWQAKKNDRMNSWNLSKGSIIFTKVSIFSKVSFLAKIQV